MTTNSPKALKIAGITAFAALASIIPSAGHACSEFYEPVPYETLLRELREPKLLNLVRSASGIYLVNIHSASKSATPLPREDNDRRSLFTTDYNFSVVGVISGPYREHIPYNSPEPGENFLPIPMYDEENNDIWGAYNSVCLDKAHCASSFHNSSGFWFSQRTSIGEIFTLGDCRDYVLFDEDSTYLLILDAGDRTLSAELIPGPDDPWLAAVKRAVDNPVIDNMGLISVEDFFLLYPFIEVKTIERCGRSPLVYSEEIPDGSSKLEQPRKAHWFQRGDDPYIEYPFSRKTCRVGDRFVALNFYQWFALDKDENIDLQDVAFAKSIVGDTIVNLSQIKIWMDDAKKMYR